MAAKAERDLSPVSACLGTEAYHALRLKPDRSIGAGHNQRGRDWLARQPAPEDEQAAIARHVRELDRLGEDLVMLERDIANGALEDEPIRRLLTITGVNLAAAAGLMAAIGSIDRFSSPQKLVSYFGLNPRVRQSGLERCSPWSHQQSWPQLCARHAG